VHNGVIEKLNSKIKTATKRADGFKRVAYLRTVVCLVLGRLNFSCPYEMEENLTYFFH